LKGTYRARIKKTILSKSEEDGGAVLDGVIALAIVIIFILMLVHFGFNLSSVVSSLKKFFGVVM
jgi:hypothetical protein